MSHPSFIIDDMARPPRSDPEAGWHHVMNRGIDHGDVFFGDPDRIEFGARLADIHERFGVQIHAYCLMDNHFHLLLHCPDGGLSAAMQRLGSLYTRHVNDRLGRDGAIFRGRFHSRIVDADAHLLAAARYIHRNALDLPGVGSPDAYRWSSHRTYLGYRRQPPWLYLDVVLGLAGGASAFGRLVGSEPADGLCSGWSADDVRHLVEAASLVLSERASTSRGSLVSHARSIVLAWAADNTAIDDDVVAEALGVTGSRAWSSAVWRARAKVRTDPEMGQLVQRSLLLVSAPVTSSHLGHGSRSGSDPDRDQRAARAAS